MNQINNLSYFVISEMSIKFKPQANERDNYDLLTVTVTDLNTLETFKIKDKLPPHSTKGNKTIDGVLARILFENGLEEWELTYHHIDWKHNSHDTDLIYEYCISNPQYFFNAIKLTDKITSWDDLIFIPSSERQQIRLLKHICNKLYEIDTELNIIANK